MTNKVNLREKLIETASRLFEINGYHGTGLNEILKEAGAAKGSLYYYFPGGKEELALESISLAGGKIINTIKDNLDNIIDPAEAIVKDILNIAYKIDNEQKPVDISISLIALESFSKSENLRKACENVYISMEKIFAEKLIKSGIDREKSNELGEVITIMIEGGITLSLTKKSGNPLRLIAKGIPDLIR